MTITLTNNGASTISIQDLAIELKSGETTLLSAYSDKELLGSTDLQAIMTNPEIEVIMAGKSVSHSDLQLGLTAMTGASHETINTLKHNVSEDYYFETAKENGQTRYITYYTDASKVIKIREEEIIRNTAGTVSEIITREYDDEGRVFKIESQHLNRGVSGGVQNITVETT